MPRGGPEREEFFPDSAAASTERETFGDDPTITRKDETSGEVGETAGDDSTITRRLDDTAVDAGEAADPESAVTTDGGTDDGGSAGNSAAGDKGTATGAGCGTTCPTPVASGDDGAGARVPDGG